MNRATDATTRNTLLNSCNRWESFNSRDKGVLVLKVPKRRPSFPSDVVLTTCSLVSEAEMTNCEVSDESDDDIFSKLLENAKTSPQSHGDDSSRFDFSSSSFVFFPQFPVPENKHLRRRIQFASTVEEREYAVTIGDNPSCHGPCALTLDWEYATTRSAPYHDEDDYDYSTDSSSRGRGRSVRYLSTDQRRKRVLQVGNVSLEDLRHLERSMAPQNDQEDKVFSPTTRRAVWPKDQKDHLPPIKCM